MSTVIIGAQFGDEGKGKIVDCIASESDVVVRFNGGNNAGHTIVVGERKYKLHLLPSGVVRGKRGLIGAGVALDPRVLNQELESFSLSGVELTPKLLGIDFRTQIILPWHAEREGAAGKAIGTTGRGIGPCYEDRAARSGIQFHELCVPKEFKKRVSELNNGKQPAFLEEYLLLSEKLKDFECDVVAELSRARLDGKKILFEGAQGTMLDNDFGTYPFVTSSHPIAGGACVGAGVPPSFLESVEGVAKAYCTRVGNGPFPTEISGKDGDYLREKGAEFGTTTGRARRVGWLDLPMLRYAHMLNGFTALHLTKLDVLGGLKELKLCTHYSYEGKKLDLFPLRFLDKASPEYLTLPGFPDLGQSEWRSIAKKGFNALPTNARNLVEKIRELSGMFIKSISIGPGRDEILWS